MYQKYIKRFFDLILSLIIFIVFLPIMLIVALLIKLEDKGPALFKQERTGKDGKIFMLYKFRSMKINNNVRDFSCDDQRTKIGTILRKTSLDELPQIINILKGDMSFIGPRPWIHEYYESMNEEQRKRTSVLPGITGLAQACGRNNISIFDKINYDLEYVKNISLKEDIRIVFLTIKTVFSKSGADLGKIGIQGELEVLRNQKVQPLVNNIQN